MSTNTVELQTPFMQRAAVLIQHNIPVAPLPPRTKAAKLDNWQGLATADPAVLQQLNPDPDGNTAAVARAELGGYCFFEVDRANFHEVIEQQTGEKFPETLLVSSSPGKGRGHFYLRQTPKSIALGNAQAKDEHGEIWSFRADRRYVVGPLSVKADGTIYTVIKDAPIADCPDWLIDWIASNKASDTGPLTASVDGPKIPRGSHDTQLTRIGGKLRQDGLEEEAIYNALVEVCEKRCENYGPHDYKQMCRKISKSVCRYPIQEPAPSVFMGGKDLSQQTVVTAQSKQTAVVTVVDRPMETESVNLVESIENSLDRLPSSVLASTRLQDIFVDFMYNDWPLSLALPALVTAASVVVPPMPRREGLVIGDDSMVNLYTALIAEVNAGKSQVANWAAAAIGIYEPPVGSHYFEGKWGSAEQMLKSLHRKQSSFINKSVLINPDEWAHLFAKAAIPDASFPTILTTSFYRRNQIFTLGGSDGGKEYMLNLAMSFIGGIVESEFDTVFGANSLGGLYDRFLFGRAPDQFHWNYRECPFEPRMQWREWDLKPVRIDSSVYEVLGSWSKENPRLGRISEICSRIAVIYASLDGRSLVTGKDVELLKPLALYQVGLRQVFRPNPGQSPDAVYANRALAWVQKHAGEWTSVSILKRSLQRLEEKVGPTVASRSLMSLAKSGRIDLWFPGDLDSPMPWDYSGPRVRIGLVRRVR